jgi:DHA2 family multidrug resistance protein
MLAPLNPAVHTFIEQSRGQFLQETGDPAPSDLMAWQSLANLRQQQAASLAYFDVFWFAAVVALGLALLLPLMKRAVAEKGAPIAAE